MASGFGIAAGIFAVYFFGEVPRVREDILGKLPIIGGYWDRSIPPEDNVRLPPSRFSLPFVDSCRLWGRGWQLELHLLLTNWHSHSKHPVRGMCVLL